MFYVQQAILSPLRLRANGRNIVDQQLPTLLDVTCWAPREWGWEMFLASRFDPFSGEFLIVLHELAGPYPSILLGFARYLWAQSLHYQFLSFKNVAFFVFLHTAISSFTPLCFHLVLKRTPRFLSSVRHGDLSQVRARKASWSMAVLGHVQKVNMQ